MITKSTKVYKHDDKLWYIIDATDLKLGRLAVEIAKILKGKNRATFTPNFDSGDNIIVINSKNVRLTGKKIFEVEFLKHTGYPGGDKYASPAQILRSKNPSLLIKRAVFGMFPPHSPLVNEILTKLYIYPDASHPHQAQKPVVLDLSKFKKNVIN